MSPPVPPRPPLSTASFYASTPVAAESSAVRAAGASKSNYKPKFTNLNPEMIAALEREVPLVPEEQFFRPPSQKATVEPSYLDIKSSKGLSRGHTK